MFLLGHLSRIVFHYYKNLATPRVRRRAVRTQSRLSLPSTSSQPPLLHFSESSLFAISNAVVMTPPKYEDSIAPPPSYEQSMAELHSGAFDSRASTPFDNRLNISSVDQSERRDDDRLIQMSSRYDIDRVSNLPEVEIQTRHIRGGNECDSPPPPYSRNSHM